MHSRSIGISWFRRRSDRALGRMQRELEPWGTVLPRQSCAIVKKLRARTPFFFLLRRRRRSSNCDLGLTAFATAFGFDRGEAGEPYQY